MRTLQVNLTTTGIRALVEMEANESLKAGIITETEREAVSNVNGHSSNMTKKYYLKEKMTMSVVAANDAFNAVQQHQQAHQQSPPVMLHATPVPTAYQHQLHQHQHQQSPPGMIHATPVPTAYQHQLHQQYPPGMQYSTPVHQQQHLDQQHQQQPQLTPYSTACTPVFEPKEWGSCHPN
jgi:hypothetical protein